MRKRNKLFSLLFVAILVCACVFPMLFAFDCPGEENDPNAKTFLYEENNVRYFCVKESKTAYVDHLFPAKYDKETGSKTDTLGDDLEVVVIPEVIKNGEYKVVGLVANKDFDYYTGTSRIISGSWKNIRKLYLPYTVETMYYNYVFYASEGAYYSEDLQVVVPNIYSMTGVAPGASRTKLYYETYFFGLYRGVLSIAPQKHYDMVMEKHNEWVEASEGNCSPDIFIKNFVTPNYVFNFNYEGAPNEGIYWIDFIDDENTVFVLPTNPTREGYTFGGWYMEETCITEWDSKMTPTAEVKNMYAKWVPVETEQPVEGEETAE